MLEPSDNGITFEGLIDALMVSLYLALHSSSIERNLYIELFALNWFKPRFCTKSAIKWSRRAGANRFLPSFQLSRWETCDLLKLYSSVEALARWFSLNRHHLQLKDLCLNLQNVVHTFAKLRVNIGDFKVTSKLFCTLWPMCWLLEDFWCKLKEINF